VGALKLRPKDGAVIEVTEARSVVGRDAAAAIVIQDRSVSRTHAVIERRGEAWFVLDQGSSNGTFVDGKRVPEAPLRDGQELAFGRVPFRVEIEAPEMAATILMARPEPAAEQATVLTQSSPSTQRADAPRPVAAPAAVRRGSPPPAQKPAAAPRVPGRPVAESAAAPAAYDLADLPSAHPVVASEALNSLIMKVPPFADGAAATAARAEGGLHPLTKLFGSLVIVLFSTALFFAIGAEKTGSEVQKLHGSLDLVNARQEAEAFRATATLVKNGALVNHKLAVCNMSAQAMRLAWLGAVQISATASDPADARSPKNYRPKRFNSAFCPKDFDVVLAPGGKRTFSLTSETDERCRWDGTAVFFALAAHPAAQDAAEERSTVWRSGMPGGDEACVQVGTGE
jgi:hypothetical protein